LQRVIPERGRGADQRGITRHLELLRSVIRERILDKLIAKDGCRRALHRSDERGEGRLDSRWRGIEQAETFLNPLGMLLRRHNVFLKSTARSRNAISEV
jgi:hypothetical protein